MTAGRWSGSLNPQIPGSVAANLGEWGLFCVVPSPLGSGIDPDDVLARSLYTGIARRPKWRPDGGIDLHGASAAILMGDEDGKGNIDDDLRILALASSATAVATAAMAYCNGITLGQIGSTTNDDVSGVLLRGQTFRAWLGTVRESVGFDDDYELPSWEWRVNPDLTFDWDEPANLWQTDPTVLVLPGGSTTRYPSGLHVIGVPPDTLTVEADAEDYATGIVYYDRSNDLGVEPVDVASVPYKNVDGTDLVMRRPIEVDLSGAGTTTAYGILATILVGNEGLVANALTGGLDVDNLLQVVRAGDWIWAHDLRRRLVDLGNELTIDGDVIHPAALRVFSMSWPVRPPYGVMWLTSGDPKQTIDLTEWFEWDTGPVRLDVGRPPRNLLDAIGGTT